jgi:hypothetical protein
MHIQWCWTLINTIALCRLVHVQSDYHAAYCRRLPVYSAAYEHTPSTHGRPTPKIIYPVGRWLCPAFLAD